MERLSPQQQARRRLFAVGLLAITVPVLVIGVLLGADGADTGADPGAVGRGASEVCRLEKAYQKLIEIEGAPLLIDVFVAPPLVLSWTSTGDSQVRKIGSILCGEFRVIGRLDPELLFDTDERSRDFAARWLQVEPLSPEYVGGWIRLRDDEDGATFGKRVTDLRVTRPAQMTPQGDADLQFGEVTSEVGRSCTGSGSAVDLAPGSPQVVNHGPSSSLAVFTLRTTNFDFVGTEYLRVAASGPSAGKIVVGPAERSLGNSPADAAQVLVQLAQSFKTATHVVLTASRTGSAASLETGLSDLNQLIAVPAIASTALPSFDAYPAWRLDGFVLKGTPHYLETCSNSRIGTQRERLCVAPRCWAE